jgi:hypothetical protein
MDAVLRALFLTARASNLPVPAARHARASFTTRRAFALHSIQLWWLALFILLGQGVDKRPQTLEASLGLCAKLCKHLAISALDIGKNCIYPRKHRSDVFIEVRKHHAPQGVKLAAQLLYSSLALFKATGEIAHTSPTCFIHELLKQTA